MNIVTKSSLLLTATLITGLISFQSHANMFGGSGQYAMMPMLKVGIWVLDTEKGKVKFCYPNAISKEALCAPWKDLNEE
jgi:hypothetical protein